MTMKLQGVPATPGKALACSATETKTTEVVIDNPDKVVYRTTETKETGWSDAFLSFVDKVLSIAAAISKVITLPIPTI